MDGRCEQGPGTSVNTSKTRAEAQFHRIGAELGAERYDVGSLPAGDNGAFVSDDDVSKYHSVAE